MATVDSFNVGHLLRIMPNLPEEKAEEFFSHLEEAMWENNITRFDRAAHFLAQLGHESSDLNVWEEAGYLPRDEQMAYLQTKDFYPYYGRGPIQLTWEATYARAGEAIGADLVGNPDLLLEPEYGFKAAAWFFNKGNPAGRDLNRAADHNSFNVIMDTILGTHLHQSWQDRWDRYIRACQTLPIPFGMRESYATRLDEALAYIWPAIDQTKYEWWTSGPVPDGSPAWAINEPPPPVEEVIRDGCFCAGVPNLMLRKVRKIVPTYGDPLWDGGTYAYWYYFADYTESFDVNRDYPHGTLIGRQFSDSRDQGHVAIVLGDGKLLQTYDKGGGLPGLNRDIWMPDSHEGYYYQWACLPENWIDYEGDEF